MYTVLGCVIFQTPREFMRFCDHVLCGCLLDGFVIHKKHKLHCRDCGLWNIVALPDAGQHHAVFGMNAYMHMHACMYRIRVSRHSVRSLLGWCLLFWCENSAMNQLIYYVVWLEVLYCISHNDDLYSLLANKIQELVFHLLVNFYVFKSSSFGALLVTCVEKANLKSVILIVTDYFP